MSTTLGKITITLVLTAGIAAAGVYSGYRWAKAAPAGAKDPDDSGDAKPEGDEKAVASVTTAVIQSGHVVRTLTAYGSVVAQSENVRVYSVPFESRVTRLPAPAGAPVEQGAALIEVEPSPDARLQLEEARIALESAKKDSEQTEQRFKSKLATNSELLQSQQALAVAQLHVTNLQQRGIDAGEATTLKAGGDGIVSKIDVQAGQIVPAGGPLIETVPQRQIEVRLGVEPGLAQQLTVGQVVKLFPKGSDSDAVEGKIRLVTQRVNPDTRLVDVFVTPGDARLLLDGFILAQLTETSGDGLVVPRAGTAISKNPFVQFTVRDANWVWQTVTLGTSNKEVAQISGEGLEEGELLVVVGNYELEDGMSVTINDKPTTEPTSATEPTSTTQAAPATENSK